MTFEECCTISIDNEELIQEFNRLTGHKLGMSRTPIQKLIDDSCNYNPDKEAIPDFCRFVFKSIWTPLVDMDN